jgi:hypothetical protein
MMCSPIQGPLKLQRDAENQERLKEAKEKLSLAVMAKPREDGVALPGCAIAWLQKSKGWNIGDLALLAYILWAFKPDARRFESRPSRQTTPASSCSSRRGDRSSTHARTRARHNQEHPSSASTMHLRHWKVTVSS